MDETCPFCRQPHPDDEEEGKRNVMKRVKKNDPLATREMGRKLYSEGDHRAAFEYYTRAAALGNIDAHFDLSLLYMKGHGVMRNEKKKLYHLEQAAIGGHPLARNNLGVNEFENDNIERAVKHFIIAASLGYAEAINYLMAWYQEGHVEKEDFDAALRAHQAAVDATKSEQREEADKYMFE